VSRLQGDTVAQTLATVRGRYSDPLLRAIEWGLKVQPELRPQSVAEWRAVFEAQAQLMPGATAPAATAPVATAPRPQQRLVQPRSDPGAGWRHLGLGLLLVLALLLGLDWHRRNPGSPETTPVSAAKPAPTADAAPAGESAAPHALPSREVAPAADSRERPSRPELVPDRVRERNNERSNGDFRAADRDGDGYLSPAEVEGRFPAIAREFSRVDRDGDRRISAEEFAELRRLQQERRPAPAR
jgi:hypothetical protein